MGLLLGESNPVIAFPFKLLEVSAVSTVGQVQQVSWSEHSLIQVRAVDELIALICCNALSDCLAIT